MGTSNQHFTVCACDLYFSRNKKYIKVENFIFQTQKTACLDLFLSFDNNDFKTRNISEKNAIFGSRFSRPIRIADVKIVRSDWLTSVACQLASAQIADFGAKQPFWGAFLSLFHPLDPPTCIHFWKGNNLSYNISKNLDAASIAEKMAMVLVRKFNIEGT